MLFNMKKIGREIATLRKGNNMTQMELADKLGISFQAVSNWERGNSMPDIAKLPELAEIFGVSVDELLGERNALVEAAINDNIAECMENHTISAEEVGAVLPILKPTQVETIVQNADKLDFSSIEKFLPFMDEADVKEFAYMAMEQGEKLDKFLPFMEEADVKELALAAWGKGEAVDKFLPFMEEADVKEFALLAVEKEQAVDRFLPFMDEDDVKELAWQVLRGKRLI